MHTAGYQPNECILIQRSTHQSQSLERNALMTAPIIRPPIHPRDLSQRPSPLPRSKVYIAPEETTKTPRGLLPLPRSPPCRDV